MRPQYPNPVPPEDDDKAFVRDLIVVVFIVIGVVLVAWLAGSLLMPDTADAQGVACPAFFAGGEAPSAGDQMICFTGFAVAYQDAWREPAWSAEEITPTSAAAGEAAPRNGTFHVCQQVPAQFRSTNADYDRAGYDKGHMTPAGDRGADKPETFGLCNMVPQKPNLNRKVWAGIEASLRNLATSGDTLYVVTGPEVGPSPQMLQDHVAVPVATWKAVDDVGHGVEAWTCTNTDTPVCTQETVAALAAQIGFDPLPGLDTATEATPFTLPPPTKGATS